VSKELHSGIDAARAPLIWKHGGEHPGAALLSEHPHALAVDAEEFGHFFGWEHTSLQVQVFDRYEPMPEHIHGSGACPKHKVA
jgi:hypothetical protein